MRQAGLQGTNPSDPRLQALLDQDVTTEELADVAREAVGKGKGWPWVLATVAGRRRDAAGLAQGVGPRLPAGAAAPAEPAGPRPETDQERYEREERERRAWTPEQRASNEAAREKAIALARSVLSIAPRNRAAGGGA